MLHLYTNLEQSIEQNFIWVPYVVAFMFGFFVMQVSGPGELMQLLLLYMEQGE